MEVFKKKSTINISNKKNNIAFFFILYTMLVFFLGAYAYRNNLQTHLKWIYNAGFDIPKNYISAIFSQPPKNISIDIKFDNFQKILMQRDKALKQSVLVVDEYVNAKISYLDKTLKTNIRLKGDWTDHLKGDKWSYRLKLKGDNTLFGMKQFSIHHPKTRNYLNEYFYHEVLKENNIIGLRYDFLNVTLNGKNLGIYALEEHFEKRLIENSKNIEGPIIRFNEDLFWDEYIQIRKENPEAEPSGYGDYLSSNVDAFQSQSILEDNKKFEKFISAFILLEKFRTGEYSTSNVFNVEKLATFFALSDIFGAEHGTRWHNAKFYYNPISSNLEPIGFDGNAGYNINSLIYTRFNNSEQNENSFKSEYYTQLFNDSKFLELYLKKLNEFSSKVFIDKMVDFHKKDLNKKLNILHREWPHYTFDYSFLYKNAEYISNFLNPDFSMLSYLKESNNDLFKLSIGNLQTIPIIVTGLIINNNLEIEIDNKYIPGQKAFDSTKYFEYEHKFENTIDQNRNIESIVIKYKLLGVDKILSYNVNLFSNELDLTDTSFLRKKPNINNFDFIDVYDKKIIVASGKHELNEDLIIPKGYSFIINSSTTIDIKNNSSILSFSPIFINGQKDKEVNFISSDKTGEGIIVMNANGLSKFNYVNFKDLSNPLKNNWNLSGAITFYESDVEMFNSSFFNNIRGDDYLNIIRSNFSIHDTNFNFTFADAADFDYSNGYMNNVEFNNIGNDGIDISGADIKIDSISLTFVGDKALSSGENSILDARDVIISNSEIAICSKDLSVINIDKILLQNNKVDFALFQKKPEFGPAKIKALNVQSSNGSQVSHLVEQDSQLILNSEIFYGSIQDVEGMMYGNEFGRASQK